MKLFFCDCSKESRLFFESVICTACSRMVGYCPDKETLLPFSIVEASTSPTSPSTATASTVSAPSSAATAPASTATAPTPPISEAASSETAPVSSENTPEIWSSTMAPGQFYRQCQNYSQHNVCNWMVLADDPNPLCRACRLNEMIPDLSVAENIEYWRKIETAKRHALYDVLALKLPLASKIENPEHGLAFRFMTDRDVVSEFTEPLEGQEPVFTGHDSGVITINLAEADDIARTRMRVRMGESYRTLLGHFRHEIGHYYWFRIVENHPELLELCRATFGDEQQDYATAKEKYYGDGAPMNWSDNFISPYAAMHPWEDWAECWAHHLHILDTLETAQTYQLALEGKAIPASAPFTAPDEDMDALLADWIRLAIAMNSLNRSMGKGDPYPFVLTAPVKDKLRLVHRIVMSASKEKSNG